MDVYAEAVAVVKKLNTAGHTAYFAGGWVRDHVMEYDSYDIDIATDATPEEITSLFSRTVQVGAAFGVVVVLSGAHQFEVATFRRDIEYRDGRKPHAVSFCSPKEDALRRDFTINGMFYDPLEHKIYDYVGGVEDIHRGIIRTIGNPYDRFLEDRLRMVRAFRFSARFNFHLDREAEEAVLATKDKLFPSVAIERVWQELGKMAAAPRFDQALVEMHRLSLLTVIFPQLEGLHLNDLKERVAPFSRFPKETPPILYLLQLFPEAAVQQMRDFCRYFKTSRKEMAVVEHYWRLKELVAQKGLDLVAWAHFFSLSDALLYLKVMEKTLPEEERSGFFEEKAQIRNRLQRHVQRIIERRPVVTGKLLKEEGIDSGMHLGRLLEEAERIAIEEDLEESGEVLQRLKESPIWP